MSGVQEGQPSGVSFENFEIEPFHASTIAHQLGVLATPHIGGASFEGFEALIRACFTSIEARCLSG